MKKHIYFVCMLMLTAAMFIACSNDDDKEEHSDLVGTWQGEYSGYDKQQSKSVYIRRELTLKSNGQYTNKIGGNMTSASSSYDEWEDESGSYSLKDGVISYNPSSDKRIDYSSKNMSYYNKGSYTERIQIESDGSWTTIDNNITTSRSNSTGVTYSMKRK